MLNTSSGTGMVIEFKFTCNELSGDVIERVCCTDITSGDRMIRTLYTDVIIDNYYTNTITTFNYMGIEVDIEFASKLC